MCVVAFPLLFPVFAGACRCFENPPPLATHVVVVVVVVVVAVLCCFDVCGCVRTLCLLSFVVVLRVVMLYVIVFVFCCFGFFGEYRGISETLS